MAASTYEKSVVSEISKKEGGGTFATPVPIGVQQQFVGALVNSGVNNLEEQYILGTDEITVIESDSDTTQLGDVHWTKMTVNYTKDTTQNGYYILESHIYDLSDIITEQTPSQIPTIDTEWGTAYYDEEKAVFTPDTVETETVGSPQVGLSNVTQTLKDLMGNDFFIIFGSENEIMMVSPMLTVRIDNLKYKDNNGDIINIAQKTTQVKVEPDPLDETKTIKTITKTIDQIYEVSV